MCIQSSYTNAQWIYINNLNNYFWYVVVILLYICCCFLLLACSSSLYTELSFFISSLFCCMCSLIMFIVNIIHTFGAECVCIFCFFCLLRAHAELLFSVCTFWNQNRTLQTADIRETAFRDTDSSVLMNNIYIIIEWPSKTWKVFVSTPYSVYELEINWLCFCTSSFRICYVECVCSIFFYDCCDDDWVVYLGTLCIC